MNSLAMERANITNALTQYFENEGTSLSVEAFIPERPNPPCIVLEPGTPYLEEGQTFCDFITRFTLILLAGNATNENSTADLDDLICKTIDALERHQVESVDQPSQFEVNNNLFLGTRIAVSREVELTI